MMAGFCEPPPNASNNVTKRVSSEWAFQQFVRFSVRISAILSICLRCEG